jgi:hypothetical protein
LLDLDDIGEVPDIFIRGIDLLAAIANSQPCWQPM